MAWCLVKQLKKEAQGQLYLYWMKVSGQLHAPAASPLEKETLLPIGYEAGWAPEQAWTRWCGYKFLAPIETQISDHPARMPALYNWAIPAVAKRKNSCPYQESKPDLPARNLVTVLIELRRIGTGWR
jgi:hypothetical protein